MPSPKELLDERLARGEISPHDYDEILIRISRGTGSPNDTMSVRIVIAVVKWVIIFAIGATISWTIGFATSPERLSYISASLRQGVADLTPMSLFNLYRIEVEGILRDRPPDEATIRGSPNFASCLKNPKLREHSTYQFCTGTDEACTERACLDATREALTVKGLKDYRFLPMAALIRVVWQLAAVPSWQSFGYLLPVVIGLWAGSVMFRRIGEPYLLVWVIFLPLVAIALASLSAYPIYFAVTWLGMVFGTAASVFAYLTGTLVGVLGLTLTALKEAVKDVWNAFIDEPIEELSGILVRGAFGLMRPRPRPIE